MGVQKYVVKLKPLICIYDNSIYTLFAIVVIRAIMKKGCQLNETSDRTTRSADS